MNQNLVHLSNRERLSERRPTPIGRGAFVSVAAGVCLSLLVSCATTPQPQHDLAKDFSQVDKLTLGRTTQADVKQLFGQPHDRLGIGKLRRQGTPLNAGPRQTVWFYKKVDPQVLEGSWYLRTEFDSNGLLVDYCTCRRGDAVRYEVSDFDFVAARDKIRAGQTTAEEVRDIVGKRFEVQKVNKAGVAYRWYYHYEYTLKGKKIVQSVGPNPWDQIVYEPIGSSKSYLKYLEVEFDSTDKVLEVYGWSNFEKP